MAYGLQAAGGDGSTGLGGLGAVTSCTLAGRQASRLLIPHRPAGARCHPTVETGSGSPRRTKASDRAPRAASLQRPCSTQPARAANWRSASVSVPPFALMLQAGHSCDCERGRACGERLRAGHKPPVSTCSWMWGSLPAPTGGSRPPAFSELHAAAPGACFPARGPPRCPAGQLPDHEEWGP